MARRGWRKEASWPGDATDPRGLTAWTLHFLEALQVKGSSEHTVSGRAASLRVFLRWCLERDLTRPTQLTRPHLLRYQRHLYFHRKRDGKPLTFSTQASRLAAVRMLFKWLTRENVILSNPASELDLPRVNRPLPQVLTPAEVEAVMALPDITDPLGLRDRAILETLYSTAIRRMEVLNLKLYDLDRSRGTLLVRAGKGNKDRTVPIGERALAWCDFYLRESRPKLVAGKEEDFLFLNRHGQGLLSTRLSQMVRRYVRQADLGKDGSCHLFRHTAATAMMEGGADLRSIQEMLGHVDLSTTQIYTQVSIRRLKQVHTQTHPAARLFPEKARVTDTQAPEDVEDLEQDLDPLELLERLLEEQDLEDADE